MKTQGNSVFISSETHVGLHKASLDPVVWIIPATDPTRGSFDYEVMETTRLDINAQLLSLGRLSDYYP
jgi:hypothetical protein